MCFINTDFYHQEAVLVHEFSGLGPPFSHAVPTTPLRTSSQLLHLNSGLAQALKLDEAQLRSALGVDILSGNKPWPHYSSIASVYCGHQFGVFVPQLGDGRALMMAELRGGASYWQLQLKGAGPTPYSRQGDGRAVLRSSVREYLASEAMHALGVPTTRALSICASSDSVYRETPETASVVCRVSASFLRFGHVEFFSHTRQWGALKALLQWHIEQHHPEILLHDDGANFSEALLQWLRLVNQRTAVLLAAWQSVGFCHGVMNTDNMSLLGLTLDYGPFGFMDAFDRHHICNHSDQQGRYSYHNQAPIAHWNMHALAYALSPLLQDAQTHVHGILDDFEAIYQGEHTRLFARKLGFFLNPTAPEVAPLIEATLRFMHQHQLDFTRFFRSLSALDPSSDVVSNMALWQQHACFPWSLGDEDHLAAAKQWLHEWTTVQQSTGSAAASLQDWRDTLNQTNPAFVLRNHLLHQAIEQLKEENHQGVDALFSASQTPYSDALASHLIAPPPSWAKHLVLSCSS